MIIGWVDIPPWGKLFKTDISVYEGRDVLARKKAGWVYEIYGSDLLVRRGRVVLSECIMV
jgi:hypothetical protein